MKNIQAGLLLHPAAWITQQQFLNRFCFIFRYLQNPGTTMSFLPSSQENTRYSPRVTLCYYTNWARVLTSAQNARFVIRFVYLLLSPLFSSFHICTQEDLQRIRIWVSPCLFTYVAHIRRVSTSDVFTIVCDTGGFSTYTVLHIHDDKHALLSAGFCASPHQKKLSDPIISPVCRDLIVRYVTLLLHHPVVFIFCSYPFPHQAHLMLCTLLRRFSCCIHTWVREMAGLIQGYWFVFTCTVP